MVLVLSARNNTNYGGNLVSQKYSPLDNIQLNGERRDYEALFEKRIDLLTNLGAYPPQPINFYYNYPVVDVAVDANQVPMVVLSSNRGAWMKKLLDNASAARRLFQRGYLAPKTFEKGAVPWYAPERSGKSPVYVVVHWSEYAFYVQQLAAYDKFTVVGFEFTATPPALDIVGLGASRYAALQLLIRLGYHRAWLVDDNAVNVNGFPRTAATVEDEMPVGSQIWGIGFTGATVNIKESQLSDGTVIFKAANLNFANTKPGLLQQVVLWNVDRFRDNHLNFCPLFVSSNEDIALCNFLQWGKRDQRVITACHVIKLQPDSDTQLANPGGTLAVPRRRKRLMRLFEDIEADIAFRPTDRNEEDPLYQYIAGTVLPNSLEKQGVAAVAESKAVEQVMARAILLKGWYPPVAFDPYGGPAQVQALLPANVPTRN